MSQDKSKAPDRIQQVVQAQRIMALMLGASLLITAFTFVFLHWASASYYDKVSERDEVNRQIKLQRKQFESESKVLTDKLEKGRQTLLVINHFAEEYGMLPTNLEEGILDPHTLQQSLEANKQITTYLSTLASKWNATTKIIYYTKTGKVDRINIKKALDEFNFPVTPVKAQTGLIPTNAVVYGESVDAEKARIVAYTLIRAGVQIKTVFQSHKPGFRSVIQVEGDPGSDKLQALTVAHIAALKLP